MFVTVLFYLFTLINILAMKDVYWPLMKDHVDAFIALHAITRSWQTAILCAVFFLKTLVKAVYKERTPDRDWETSFMARMLINVNR